MPQNIFLLMLQKVHKMTEEKTIKPEMNKDGTMKRCKNCGNKTIIKKDTAYPFYYEILPVGQLRCNNCHCIILTYGECGPEDLAWNDIMETVECTPELWEAVERERKLHYAEMEKEQTGLEPWMGE